MGLFSSGLALVLHRVGSTRAQFRAQVLAYYERINLSVSSSTALLGKSVIRLLLELHLGNMSIFVVTNTCCRQNR